MREKHIKTATDWEKRANKKGKHTKTVIHIHKFSSGINTEAICQNLILQTRKHREIVQVRLKRGLIFLDLHSNSTHAITCAWKGNNRKLIIREVYIWR